jgi:hypothetical protein
VIIQYVREYAKKFKANGIIKLFIIPGSFGSGEKHIVILSIASFFFASQHPLFKLI